VTEDEMDALTGGTTNKSEKIRLLNAAGVSTADIARYLTIRYQHVYNVLLRAGVIVKAEPKPASEMPVGDTIVLSLEPGGLVRLPETMLTAQGLSDGDRLICRTSPDGLMIMSRARALDHLREVARSRMPEEADLFEALLGGDRTVGKPGQAP
jgi:antitoxin component of MazEF toxin-antitoxin module